MVQDRSDPDTVVEDEPVRSRTKTSPHPKPGHRIEIDIDDADSLSDFLLTISRLVRERRKITIVVE